CRELGCLENSIKDPKNIPRTRMYKVRYNSYDENAINYARVKYLKGDFDSKKIIKQLANNQIIDTENEMNAWLWYFRNCRKSIKGERFKLIRSIKKAQNYTNQ